MYLIAFQSVVFKAVAVHQKQIICGNVQRWIDIISKFEYATMHFKTIFTNIMQSEILPQTHAGVIGPLIQN